MPIDLGENVWFWEPWLRPLEGGAGCVQRRGIPAQRMAHAVEQRFLFVRCVPFFTGFPALCGCRSREGWGLKLYSHQNHLQLHVSSVTGEPGEEAGTALWERCPGCPRWVMSRGSLPADTEGRGRAACFRPKALTEFSSW